MADLNQNPYAPRLDEAGVKNRLTFLRPQFKEQQGLDDKSFANWYSSEHPDDQTLSAFAAGRVLSSPAPQMDTAPQAQPLADSVPQNNPSLLGTMYRTFGTMGQEAKQGIRESIGATDPTDQSWSGIGKRVASNVVGDTIANAPTIVPTTAMSMSNLGLVRNLAPLYAAGSTFAKGISEGEDSKTAGLDALNVGAQVLGAKAGVKTLGKFSPALAEASTLPGFAARAGAGTVGAGIASLPIDLTNHDPNLSPGQKKPETLWEKVKMNAEQMVEPEALLTRIATDTAWGAHEVLTEVGAHNTAKRDAKIAGQAASLDSRLLQNTVDIAREASPLSPEVNEIYKTRLALINEQKVRDQKIDPAKAESDYAASVTKLKEQVGNDLYKSKMGLVPATAASNYLDSLVARELPKTPDGLDLPVQPFENAAQAPTGAAIAPTGASTWATPEAKPKGQRPTAVTPEEYGKQVGKGEPYFNKPEPFIDVNRPTPEAVNGHLIELQNSPSLTYDQAPGLFAKNSADVVKKFLDAAAPITRPEIALTKDIPARGVYIPKDNTRVGIDLRKIGPSDAIRLGVLGEEVSHNNVHELSVQNPEAFKQVTDYFETTTPESRKAVIDLVNKTTGSELDPKYYSGEGFKSNARSLMEFFGGITNALGQYVIKTRSPAALDRLVGMLPDNIQQVVYRGVNKFINTLSSVGIGDGAQGFTPESVRDLLRAKQVMEQHFLKHERLNNIANKALAGIDSIAADSLQKNLRTAKSDLMELYPKGNFEGEQSVKDAFKEVKEAFSHRVEEKGVEPNMFERNWMPHLQLALRFPEIRRTFDTLSQYNGLVTSATQDALANIGGYGDGKTSQPEALKKVHDLRVSFLTSLTLPLNFGKAAAENQRRRAEGEPLLTPDELKTNFKIPEKHAETIRNLLEHGDVVAKQVSVMKQEKNAWQFAQELFRYKPQIGLDKAYELGSQFNQQSIDFGIMGHKLKQLKNTLEKQTPGSAEHNGTKIRIQQLNNQIALSESSTANRLVQMGFAPPEAQAAAQTLNLKMRVFGQESVNWAQLTRNKGYRPQTRRGQHLLVFQDADGNTVRTFDHNSKERADTFEKKYLEENPDHVVKRFDKVELKKQYQNLHLDDIDQLRLQQRDLLKQLVDEKKLKYVTDPNAQAALEEIAAEYDAPELDFKSAQAVKGEANTLARKNIAGFSENDYLPNIFEYSRKQITKAQRDITKAKFAAEILDPFYVQNPKLREQATQNKDYVLNASNYDLAKMRAFFNTWAVGGSISQMAMNPFQQLANGIPVAMRKLNSAGSKGHEGDAMGLLTKSIAKSTMWTMLGEVKGDRQMSEMLSLAKKLGITTPSNVENFVPENALHSDDLAKLSNVLNDDGTYGVTDIAKVNAMRGVNLALHMLRSSAAIGEAGNRTISFIQGIDIGRKLGITNEKKLFDFAAQHAADVNFSGDKANRVGVLQKLNQPGANNIQQMAHGGALTVAALKSFTLNHLAQLYTLARKNELGAWDYKNEVRGNARDNNRAAYSAFGSLLLIAGASGLVGMQDADELLKAASTRFDPKKRGWNDWVKEGTNLLKSKFDDPHSQAVVQFLGDAIRKGVPFASTGIDTSKVGLGQLVGINSDESFAENLGNAAGIAPGTTSQMTSALGETLAGGDATSIARAGSPSIVRQLLKIKDIAETGQPLTSYGKPTSLVPLSEGQKVGEALGFNSSGRVETTAFKRQDKAVEDWLKSQRAKVKTSVAEALGRGDQKTANEIVDGLVKRGASVGLKIDPASLIQGIAEEQVTPKGKSYLPDTTKENNDFIMASSASLRQQGASFRPLTPAWLQSFDTAVKLKQPQEVLKLVQSLDGPAAYQKVLSDRLVQTGRYSPSEARELVQLLTE
jgi:hypothetical protein